MIDVCFFLFGFKVLYKLLILILHDIAVYILDLANLFGLGGHLNVFLNMVNLWLIILFVHKIVINRRYYTLGLVEIAEILKFTLDLVLTLRNNFELDFLMFAESIHFLVSELGAVLPIFELPS